MKHILPLIFVTLASTSAHAMSAAESATLLDQFVAQFENEAAIVRENLRVHEKRVELAIEQVSQGKTLKTSPTLGLIVQKSRESANRQLSTANLLFTVPAEWMIDQIEQDLGNAKTLPAAQLKLQRVWKFLRAIRSRI